jgi:PelA/Pel-15E family pectate lyase
VELRAAVSQWFGERGDSPLSDDFLNSVTRGGASVKAGEAWFEAAALHEIRIEKINGDRQVIKDASAPLLWARFYDLETGLPFFSDRDGIKKSKLSDIGKERRNG